MDIFGATNQLTTPPSPGHRTVHQGCPEVTLSSDADPWMVRSRHKALHLASAPRGVPSGICLEEVSIGRNMPNSCLSSWERHSPGRWSDLQESHQAGPNFTLETEAQRGGKTFQHHTARKRPRWARTWPKAGRDVPSFWSQGLSLLPGHWGRHDCGRERHAASPQSPCEGKQVLWSPERLQRPSSAPGAPAEMHKLAPVETQCFVFVPQRAPWRRPAGCLGSAEFIYLRGSSALSMELKGAWWGAFSQLPPGARVGLRPSKRAGQGDRPAISLALYRPLHWNPGLSRAVGRPLPCGGAGLQIARRLASGSSLHSRTCLGDSG